MDILSVVGIAVFCLGMFLAVGMEADQLLHGRSFNIVIVGSLGVVMLRSTLAEFLNLFPTVLKVFRHKVDKPTDLIDQMVELATIARKDGMIALENQEISNRMLAKGVRALVDGNDAGFVRSSLERDTLITSQRHESARSILQSWGDTAPAMGMIGTLIGLVLLLAKLEEDPAGIGAGMSTALITTLYGAILANGALIPMAQKLENHAKREALNNELIVEGVVFIQKGGNPRLLADLLSSFLAPKVNRKRQAEAS